MKKIILSWITMVLCVHSINAQHNLRVIVRNEENNTPLYGAAVQIQGTTMGTGTNEEGFAQLTNIPNGKQTILVSFVGFRKKKTVLTFPLVEERTVEISLEPLEEELEEIIVSSTRISRSIDNIPTRIETLSFEEIDEKSNMRPTNVSMLLHESTGIQVQQTSYTSATQTVRIQGLDGKYTQLLKDGFPNYSGFSSGLSILDIPPLDLKQVEIIKGSASTLYGGGAIAGVINFISKEPGEDREANFILNQTSALGTDVGAFISNRYKKTGFTLMGTAHYQKEYDVDDDDFTELPLQKEFTLFPKLFLYPSDKTKIIFGNSFTWSHRLGGDVFAIQGNADNVHAYFEKNQSYRNNAYFILEQRNDRGDLFAIRQSVNTFSRDLSKPDYLFSATQTIAYTDVSYITSIQKHTVVVGANYIHDALKEKTENSVGAPRNQIQNTISLYSQDNWDISEKILLEGGLRLDHTIPYGTFLLPRISMLYKIHDNVSSRLGGGLGYKAPTLFVEETESLYFQEVEPLSDELLTERSYGLNLDINFTKDISDRLSFTLNQLFFLTQINDPLILRATLNDRYAFANEQKPILTQGFETNARIIFDPFKLFIGYTYVDAKATYKEGNQFVALAPRQRLNLILLMEKHGDYKMGLEGYWTDRQYVSSGRLTREYWEFGFFAEKIFNPISLFINFENFTDTRQNRFEQVVFPPHENPTFEQVYMHTEGFIINGGIKLRL